jgi:tRNA modification GTPase
VQELPYDTKEPIAALATPWGKSALAVIRSSGEGAISLFAPAFSRPAAIERAASGRMLHGFLRDPATGEAVDEVMAAVFRPPEGYTGQESVEIYAHGSPPGIRRILDLLSGLGFRPAAPGEFTLRAFVAGKMDLTRAEAVREIVEAKSERAQGLALGRLSGNLSRRIDALKQRVASLLAAVEVGLDYPEEELEEPPELDTAEIGACGDELRRLLATYRSGRLYQEGAAVAIAGPTNAGKSSLFNLFLREDRSIVSGIHGTTRDYIESWITLAGIPVRLFDTAGIREAEHPLEAEGIRRSGTVTEQAALVLYVADGAAGPDARDREIFTQHRADSRYIFLWNKIDLAAGAAPEGWLPISAESGEGFAALEGEIEARLRGGETGAGEGELLIDSDRQKRLLEQARDALERAQQGLREEIPMDMLAPDLREALDRLGEITGEVTSADILQQIFSDFCVGK